MNREDREALNVIADQLEEAGYEYADAIREIANRTQVLGDGQTISAEIFDYAANWLITGTAAEFVQPPGEPISNSSGEPITFLRDSLRCNLTMTLTPQPG